MQKKFIYLVAALIVLLALIGPAISNFYTGPRGADNVLTPPTGAPLPAENAVAGGFPESAGNQKAPETFKPPEKTAGEKSGDSAITGGGKASGPAGAPQATQPAQSAGSQSDAGSSTPLTPAQDSPAASGCRVDIAVVGMKGQLLYGPATVTVAKNNKWGLTALGALDATGLKYSMSPVYGNFVLGIAGQDNKGMGGWMYKVNEEIPMVAASEKAIRAGDKIIWWYSETLNSTGPAWQELKGASP
ncbi:MAG: hypothetical protein PWR22_2070 [Moorella sp. (in: firmicutes)]|nr:hypothetical protein [Moorella sp. (in: firmicutes)]